MTMATTEGHGASWTPSPWRESSGGGLKNARMGTSNRYTVGDPAGIAMEREALALRTRLFGPSHPLVAETTGYVGFALWLCGPPSARDEAETLYRRAVTMFDRLHDPPLNDHARTVYTLGCVLRSRSKYDEAEAEFVRGLELWERLPYRPDRYVAECTSDYASLLLRKADHAGAERHFRRYLEMTPEGFHDRRVNLAIWRLGRCRQEQGDGQEAARLYRRSIRQDLQWLAEQEHDLGAEAREVRLRPR